ncbi:MAG: hypothetical protein ABEJ92_03225, partial [Halobacteriales archaeon]
MTSRRLVLALVLVTVVASIGVGAAAPGGASGDPATPTAPTNATAGGMGTSISMFLAASVAQTSATVENGMWAAAFASADTNATKRALLEERFGDLNRTVAQLRAERQALRAAYRNGTIDRTTYRARMASLAGQLAALGESLETVRERGRAVGVNMTRLEALRSAASELAGGEVAAIARNLTGGRGPPGQAGLFDGGPGRAGEPGAPPANATNRSTDPGPPDEAGGPPGTPGDGRGRDGPPANRSERPTDAGPPDDPGNRSDGDAHPGRNGEDGQEADPDDPGDGGGEPPADPG